MNDIVVKPIKLEVIAKLDKTISAFDTDLASLRTGRASASMLDGIKVDSYGAMVPLEQVSTISVPEPRTIFLSVWDKSMVVAVEGAIRSSNLGVNPVVEGTKIRLPLPSITEERRKELVKKASEYAEKARVAIRHNRKIYLDALKDLQKAKQISEDEFKINSEHFEKDVKGYIEKIDDILSKKSKEMMQV
jgi:ribosome recycling factor